MLFGTTDTLSFLTIIVPKATVNLCAGVICFFILTFAATDLSPQAHGEYNAGDANYDVCDVKYLFHVWSPYCVCIWGMKNMRKRSRNIVYAQNRISIIMAQKCVIVAIGFQCDILSHRFFTGFSKAPNTCPHIFTNYYISDDAKIQMTT